MSSFQDGQFTYPAKAHEVDQFQVNSSYLSALFNSYLDQARATLARTEKIMQAPTYVVSEYAAGNVKHDNSPLADSYRWYVTRNEAYQDFKAKYMPSPNEQVLPDVMIQVHQREEGEESGMQVEEASHSVKRATSEKELEREKESKTESGTTPLAATASASASASTAANPFAVKITGKKVKREGCLLSNSGKEVTPLSVVSMVQEPGVEFKYHTGVDGTLEFTAVVPGMEFKERVKYMKKNKELFPEVPTRLMKLMGRKEKNKQSIGMMVITSTYL